MELPKNIVQIGIPDKRYKVFMEDYVISYIKEINRSLYGGQAGVAFYGKKYAEDGVDYYFIYGAIEVFGLEGRGQYLSEKEKEQIEIKRLEFFEELEFLAWCTLSGELPDGFILLEQGKGVIVNGYATFFEKNENMLNFMLIIGKRENQHAPREDVDGRLADGGNIDHRIMERSQKLSDLRRAGEDRNRAFAEVRADKYARNGSWKTVVVGLVVTLCVIGIAALSDEEKRNDFQVIARQIMENFGEQKLPDMETAPQENFEEVSQWETIEIETLESEIVEVAESEPESEKSVETETPVVETTEPEIVVTEPVATETTGEGEPVISDAPETNKMTTYIVQKGDALLSICRNHYGSDARLQEICELNQIEDPDDIKVGQTILLPE